MKYHGSKEDHHIRRSSFNLTVIHYTNEYQGALISIEMTKHPPTFEITRRVPEQPSYVH